MKIWKWLYPGIKLKRWIFLLLLGLIVINLGLLVIFSSYFLGFFQGEIALWLRFLSGPAFPASLLLGLGVVGLGLFVVIMAIKQTISRISREEDELVEHLYQEEKLKKGSRIVALGGGTGLANFLRGIKFYTSNVTAVVTVADDGGSSGKLRDELNMPPPGDIRNCLVALADTEPLMEDLFQYRFSSEGHLVGHSFGNLFIASMNEVLGDFKAAVRESSKVLAIRGEVLPATNQDVRLGAVFADDSCQIGESIIPLQNKKISQVFLEPEDCRATAEALRAIEEAEIIVVGPGSLYTSILPNLLVPDLLAAIKKSPAMKVYICNLMTQPGETVDYSASAHLQAIYRHAGDNLFDWIIVNRQEAAEKLARRYEEEGAFPVKVDHQELKEMGIRIKEENLLLQQKDSYLRHDPDRLAEVVLDLLED